MTRDELLRALIVERQTNPWWKTPPQKHDDSEIARAKRRRQLAEDYERGARSA